MRIQKDFSRLKRYSMDTGQALSFIALAFIIGICFALFLRKVILIKEQARAIAGEIDSSDRKAEMVTADIEGIKFTGRFEGAVTFKDEKIPVVTGPARKSNKMSIELMFKSVASAFLFQAHYSRFPQKCLIRYGDGQVEEFLIPTALVSDFRNSLMEAVKVKNSRGEVCRNHNRVQSCENCPFNPVCPESLKTIKAG
jgi:hypothetical protein